MLLLPAARAAREGGTGQHSLTQDHIMACGATSEQAGLEGPLLHLAASLLQGQTQVASAGGGPDSLLVHLLSDRVCSQLPSPP